MWVCVMRGWIVGLVALALAGCTSVGERGEFDGPCSVILHGLDHSAMIDPADRIAALSQVLDTCGDSDPVGRGNIHFARAMSYSELNNWQAVTENMAGAAAMLETAVSQGHAIGARRMASIYLRAELYEEGLVWAERAVEETDDDHRLRNFQVLSFYYDQLEDRDGQVSIAQAMTRQWPEEKRNWQNYAAALVQAGREREAFDVQVTMYERGLLTESREIVRVAQWYSYYEEPVPGAELLERELEAGRVDRTSTNYRSLALMWRQATQPGRAVRPAFIVAQATDSSQAWLFLAKLHQTLGRNAAGRAALIRGMATGDGLWKHELWSLEADLFTADDDQPAARMAREVALFYDPMPEPEIAFWMPPSRTINTATCRVEILDLLAVASIEERVDRTGLVVIIPTADCSRYYDQYGVALDGSVDLSASPPLVVARANSSADGHREIDRMIFMRCREPNGLEQLPGFPRGCRRHYDEDGNPVSDVAHRFAEQDRLGW